MAQTILIKRSNTSNAIPSTSQLSLGELALNTADAKLYMRKYVDGTNANDTITLVGDTSTIAATTLTGNLSMGDNIRARFGDSNDLQIYHNATNSIIADTGSGFLSLQSNGTEIALYDAANNANMGRFITGGAVNLFYNGNTKFQTTNTGIQVTGIVKHADGTVADPSITFTDDTNTGIYSSAADTVDIATGGIRRAYFNSAGITSGSNVYTASNGDFRNYGGVWEASTGLTGNGFSFVNSVDGTAATISSTGNAVFSGTVTATGGSSTNWNTAYGWGNHATAGYITTVTAGSGLTGGGTSGSVTLAIGATNIPELATELSSSVDLDDLNGSEAGFYYQTGNSDTAGNNYPSGEAGSLLVQKSAGNATQLYQTYDSVTPNLYIRANYSTGYGSWRKVWTNGNDGASSGLDADLLDGQQGSYYAPASHAHSNYITAETNAFIGDGGSGSTHPGTGRGVYSGNLPQGTSALGMSTTDNSNSILTFNRHNGEYNSQIGFSSNSNMYYRSFSGVAINSTQTWRKVWDSGNDGASSGLDADLLDGQHGSYYAAASHVHSYLPLAGGTLTGNILFNDSVVARWGNGADLKIYHDGTNSYIEDSGTGNLKIRTNALNIMNAANNQSMISAAQGAAVTLYYNNSAKLATTNTGINVAGTANVGGLTVNSAFTFPTADGSANQILKTNGSGTLSWASASAVTQVADTDNNTKIQVEESADENKIRFDTAGSERMIIDATGNVGIGTTSPQGSLSISNSGAEGIEFFPGNFTDGNAIQNYNRSTSAYVSLKQIAADYRFNIGTAEKVRLTSAGNLGIGITAPSHRLYVQDSDQVNGELVYLKGGTTRGAGIVYSRADAYTWFTGIGGSSSQDRSLPESFWGVEERSASNSPVRLAIAYTTGNVGIGTSAPDAKLRIDQDAATVGLKVTGGSGGTNIAQFIRDVGGNASVNINASGADPQIQFVSAGNTFALGVNSNTFEIADNSSLGANTRFSITNTGNVGIGTSAPTNTDYGSVIPKLHVKQSGTTGAFNLVARFEAGSDANETGGAILINHSNDRGMLIEGGRDGSGSAADDEAVGHLGLVNSGGVHTRMITLRQNMVGVNSVYNVGIGTTAPQAKFQVEDVGIDTTTTSTTATTQIAIDSMVAATFRSARYTIQVTNSTDSTYHLTEMLLIHNGTTPSINEFGTIFTGSAAEAAFTADITSGNVRILATPASTDAMAFKVVRHSITV